MLSDVEEGNNLMLTRLTTVATLPATSVLARVCTGVGFSNLKKFWTRNRVEKFWDRRGIGV